jgi:hypothetical protein
MQPTITLKRRLTLIPVCIFFLLSFLACESFDQSKQDIRNPQFYSNQISEKISFSAHDGAEILFICDSIAIKDDYNSVTNIDTISQVIQNNSRIPERQLNQRVDTVIFQGLYDIIKAEKDGVFVEITPLPRYRERTAQSIKTFTIGMLESHRIDELIDN